VPGLLGNPCGALIPAASATLNYLQPRRAERSAWPVPPASAPNRLQLLCPNLVPPASPRLVTDFFLCHTAITTPTRNGVGASFRPFLAGSHLYLTSANLSQTRSIQLLSSAFRLGPGPSHSRLSRAVLCLLVSSCSCYPGRRPGKNFWRGWTGRIIFDIPRCTATLEEIVQLQKHNTALTYP
jgi:hypothetical protein